MFGLGVLNCPVSKPKTMCRSKQNFPPDLLKWPVCCWMHGKAGKGVGVSLVTLWPFLAHCTRSNLNWVMLKSTKIMWSCALVWVKSGAPSPVCPRCFTPDNSYSISQAHSTSEYFWEPLGAWWHLCVPGGIFSCLPALSHCPVEAEPPHKNSQCDFIVFSLINLCRKPKAIPVPGSSSLAGNPNFTERSNMTVVMKTRQKQKNCEHFYCHWSHHHPQSIFRAVSNASPHLGPSQNKAPSQISCLTITSNFSFILSHSLTLITLWNSLEKRNCSYFLDGAEWCHCRIARSNQGKHAH